MKTDPTIYGADQKTAQVKRSSSVYDIVKSENWSHWCFISDISQGKSIRSFGSEWHNRNVRAQRSSIMLICGQFFGSSITSSTPQPFKVSVTLHHCRQKWQAVCVHARICCLRSQMSRVCEGSTAQVRLGISDPFLRSEWFVPLAAVYLTLVKIQTVKMHP